jgi:hypothetical protein
VNSNNNKLITEHPILNSIGNRFRKQEGRIELKLQLRTRLTEQGRLEELQLQTVSNRQQSLHLVDQ